MENIINDTRQRLMLKDYRNWNASAIIKAAICFIMFHVVSFPLYSFIIIIIEIIQIAIREPNADGVYIGNIFFLCAYSNNIRMINSYPNICIILLIKLLKTGCYNIQY